MGVPGRVPRLREGDGRFLLRNNLYVPGSKQGYKQWELDIDLPREQAETLIAGIESQLADTPHFSSASTIGAQVAGNTQQLALLAISISLLGIVAYIWFRFHQVMFGLAAVVAVFHDVLITLGAIALSYYVAGALGFLLVDPFKINLTVVAALLTIIGYSLNDTIVIFDRLREIRGKNPQLTSEMINQANNQSLSRTLLTSLTTFMVVMILYVVGGEGLRPFAFAMVVGVVCGTYSTIYIACPVVLWMHEAGRRASKQGSGAKAVAASAASE